MSKFKGALKFGAEKANEKKFGMKNAFASKKADDSKDKMELAEQDANGVKSEFIQNLNERQKKFQQDTDMETFICIAFQNRAQKDEFLKAKGWDELGDKYFAAIDIAPIEKVKITIDTSMRKAFKFKSGLKTM
jgi:uncharacterized SAM-dependent methyltransferase